MRYGFFGGSFNPVTKAHIGLALDICSKYNLDKVIFVPVGNNYNKKDLASEQDRFNMLKIATLPYSNLEVSDIELNLTHNLNTWQALSLISTTYQEPDKYFIIGADNLNKMLQQKELEMLAQKFNYIVISRGMIDCNEIIKSNDILSKYKEHFAIMENKKHTNTNATNIRKNIGNKDLQEILNIEQEVLEYIQNRRLYL